MVKMRRISDQHLAFAARFEISLRLIAGWRPWGDFHLGKGDSGGGFLVAADVDRVGYSNHGLRSICMSQKACFRLAQHCSCQWIRGPY